MQTLLEALVSLQKRDIKISGRTSNTISAQGLEYDFVRSQYIYFERIRMKYVSLYVELLNTLPGSTHTGAWLGAVPPPPPFDFSCSAFPVCELFSSFQALFTFRVLQENVVLYCQWFSFQIFDGP
jgi:hypothetical protein